MPGKSTPKYNATACLESPQVLLLSPMSNIIEQGPIHSGGLTIGGSPAQILLTRRQQLTPPEELSHVQVSNGNGYNDILDTPGLHSTKQKVIREVIKSALTKGQEVSSRVDGETNGSNRYESVEGTFRLVGPFVVGSAKATKRENGITDTYNHAYQKHSVGRIGLKGVLGMQPVPIWKRVLNHYKR